MNETRRVTRRAVLATGGALGVGALAGCIGASGRAAASVLSAGSLLVVFAEDVGPAFERDTDYGFRGEFHGSKTVMRMVEDGQKHPDVVVSADVGLLRDALESGSAPRSDWDVVFAANEVGVTYNPETAVGTRLEAGEPWYEVLRDPDAEVARSDPDLDPLGYRTVQLFELAEQYYEEPGLAADLQDALRVDPEESHLLAAVETGDRAAAIAYENMAVDHDLSFVHLPPECNFSDPQYADHYASVAYEMDDGTTVRGSPVLYAATVLDGADNPDAGEAFLGYLLDNPDLLESGGLVVSDSLPMGNGDVPSGVMP